MIIYIKENSIVTEHEYSTYLKALLISEGFTALTVVNRGDDKPYTADEFEKVNGQWGLK
jgi:hypothetical protein